MRLIQYDDAERTIAWVPLGRIRWYPKMPRQDEDALANGIIGYEDDSEVLRILSYDEFHPLRSKLDAKGEMFTEQNISRTLAQLMPNPELDASIEWRSKEVHRSLRNEIDWREVRKLCRDKKIKVNYGGGDLTGENKQSDERTDKVDARSRTMGNDNRIQIKTHFHKDRTLELEMPYIRPVTPIEPKDIAAAQVFLLYGPPNGKRKPSQQQRLQELAQAQSVKVIPSQITNPTTVYALCRYCATTPYAPELQGTVIYNAVNNFAMSLDSWLTHADNMANLRVGMYGFRSVTNWVDWSLAIEFDLLKPRPGSFVLWDKPHSMVCSSILANTRFVPATSVMYPSVEGLLATKMLDTGDQVRVTNGKHQGHIGTVVWISENEFWFLIKKHFDGAEVHVPVLDILKTPTTDLSQATSKIDIGSSDINSGPSIPAVIIAPDYPAPPEVPMTSGIVEGAELDARLRSKLQELEQAKNDNNTVRVEMIEGEIALLKISSDSNDDGEVIQMDSMSTVLEHLRAVDEMQKGYTTD
eukprot:gene373-174_t